MDLGFLNIFDITLRKFIRDSNLCEFVFCHTDKVANLLGGEDFIPWTLFVAVAVAQEFVLVKSLLTWKLFLVHFNIKCDCFFWEIAWVLSVVRNFTEFSIHVVLLSQIVYVVSDSFDFKVSS